MGDCNCEQNILGVIAASRIIYSETKPTFNDLHRLVVECFGLCDGIVCARHDIRGRSLTRARVHANTRADIGNTCWLCLV